MFTTTISHTNIGLMAASILCALAFAVAMRKMGHNYRRPNGKKGGIVSIHVTIVFAIVACLVIVTKDWVVAILGLIVAYLMAKSKLLENQHYMYQVVMSAIVGACAPVGVFYLFHRYKNRSGGGDDGDDDDDDRDRDRDRDRSSSSSGSSSSGSSSGRSSKHSKHADHRREADNAPHLKLRSNDDEL